MVAEIGELQVEFSPNEARKGPEKCPAAKLSAKRAAMMARKRSRGSSKTLSQGNTEKPQQADSTANKKKKSKFVPAPWLCEDMKVESTAAIRSDVDDAKAVIEGKLRPGSEIRHYDDSDSLDIDELELVMLYRTRLKKKRCLMHQVRNVPDLNFATRRKLEDKVKKHGEKVVINSSIMSRLKACDDEVTYVKERRNDKTSQMLNYLGLRTRNELEQLEPKRVEQSGNSSTKRPPKPNYTRAKRCRACIRGLCPGRHRARKPRWTREQREERLQGFDMHEYALVTENVDHDDPEETNLLCFLLDLQHREMTPEDYDMLLRLDEKIAPKTIGTDKLASLRTVTVSDGITDGPTEGVCWEDSLCAVCMEPYEKDQTVKFLQCDHFFHSNCIEMWLNNSGNTCPLDGLEV